MSARSLLVTVAAVLGILAACTEPVPAHQTITLDPDAPTTVLPTDHVPVTATGGGTASSGGGSATGGSGGGANDGGTVALEQMGTRRLSVAQLQNSMPVVLGGTTWLVGSANGFTTRAATLGVPDYIDVVDENLEPSPLYSKFAGDAARDACNRRLTIETALDSGVASGTESLLRFAGPNDTLANGRTRIDANLRYLKLRFHAVMVDDTDDVPIAQYRALFSEAFTAAKAANATDKNAIKEGWRAVCVGLLTAPEYHVY